MCRVIVPTIFSVIEVSIGQKILRDTRTTADKVVTITLMLQIVCALILDNHAFGAKVIARLVGFGHRD